MPQFRERAKTPAPWPGRLVGELPRKPAAPSTGYSFPKDRSEAGEGARLRIVAADPTLSGRGAKDVPEGGPVVAVFRTRSELAVVSVQDGRRGRDLTWTQRLARL